MAYVAHTSKSRRVLSMSIKTVVIIFTSIKYYQISARYAIVKPHKKLWIFDITV